MGIAGLAILCLLQVPDLSGTWKLNVVSSRWGAKPKPAGIVIHIEHHEPEIHVSGTVATARESSDTFDYRGAVDGQERTVPDGRLMLKRIDPRTIESTWKSTDGRYQQTSRTTLSQDGKRLRREVDLKRPEGELKWTEVYDRADSSNPSRSSSGSSSGSRPMKLR